MKTATRPALRLLTNMQELVHETQRMSEEASYMSALEDLQIVALLRRKLGVGGITDVPPLDDLVAHARFELNGKVLEPLVGGISGKFRFQSLHRRQAQFAVTVAAHVKS